MSNEIVWEIEYYEHSNDKQPFSEGEIETEFGDKLEWMSDKKSYKQISYKNREMDPADETDWHNQHTWLSNTLEKLYTVLHPRIEMLKDEF